MEYNYQLSFNITDEGETEYIARCLELPAVIGVGKSEEDAVEEAQDNLKFYLKYRWVEI